MWPLHHEVALAPACLSGPVGRPRSPWSLLAALGKEHPACPRALVGKVGLPGLRGLLLGPPGRQHLWEGLHVVPSLDPGGGRERTFATEVRLSPWCPRSASAL